MRVRVGDVKVGDRTRRDLGDIKALAASINSLGLLQPIGVSTNGQLVYGQRRIEAVKLLGWKEIPAVLIDLENPLEAERDENEERKDFTPSERVAIARRIEERLTQIGKQRRLDPDLHLEIEPPTRANTSSKQAARAVGMSDGSYHRAKTVAVAAAEHPDLRSIAEAMDNGAMTINAAYERTKEVLDDMNKAATNGSERPAQKRERPLAGMQKRTGLKAQVRLERIAVTLQGYADALPEMHTRGEDVVVVLDQIEHEAGRVRSAVRRLKKELADA